MIKQTSNSAAHSHFALRASVIGGLLMFVGTLQAGPVVPANLGSGLGDVVARRISGGALGTPAARSRRGPESDMLVVESDGIMRDSSGRVLVNILVHGGKSNHAKVRAAIAAVQGVSITAEDPKYKAGVIEGYVPEEALIGLARVKGVSAIHGVNRPTTNVGSTTQQGVVQHRVNLLPPNLDGTGITIGVLSDSYNTAATTASGAPLTVRESNDIASCDLPGPGNPCGNTQPVVIFEDFGTYPNASSIDEGRAMAQLIHDVAPKARLGFASAFNGDVSFANNIRALAGIQGLPNSRADFAAQIIVDDVQYFNEGMFADTVVAQAVDDVTALGVAYFSSAGNTPPTQGYAADFRLVPAGPSATDGTNINLGGVPPSLYAGGFHNFRSDGGQDIAQTVNLGSVAGRRLRVTMQWDDPYDVTPTSLGPVVFTSPASLDTPTSAVDRVVSMVQGKQYQVDVQGDSTAGNGPGNLDVIVSVILPDGNTLSTIDTGAGETFTFFAPQGGNYTIRVQGFLGDTGPFVLTVNEGTGVSKMTSDFNMLFFHPTTGAYMGCICESNLATNRPVELPGTLRFPSTVTTGQVQMVISRANTPTGPGPVASRLRYKMLANGTDGLTGSPAEYFSYSTPITYGHNSAAGANGVAAYSPFRPSAPEDFTSTGPVRIVWDRNNNRIPEAQQIRLKPEMAAMDGGNTTFFTSDTSRDLDAYPNFFGTSAAAPTAASIAALVLQNKGGPGSVTPAQMRTMLQRSAFSHDLDPHSAKGTAVATPNRGKVTVSLNGDNSATGRTDPNAFAVSYVGTSYITSITFSGVAANPDGGSVLGDSPGLLFDTRSAGFPFVVGPASVGIGAANVSATPLNPAPAPGVVGQFQQLKLDFTANAFTGGKTLRFGVGRAFAKSAFSPPTGGTQAANSADLAGSNVRIPAGTLAPGGISFAGTLADGSTFSGILANRIGAGWSFLDGFGFINAQNAVSQTLP